MPQPQKPEFKYALRFLLMGLGIILLLLICSPAVSWTGEAKSVLAVAEASSWQKLCDWPATWCSLKIMLLSVSGLLMTISIQEFLAAFHRSNLAKCLLLLFVFPILGMLAGFYFFLKSIF